MVLECVLASKLREVVKKIVVQGDRNFETKSRDILCCEVHKKKSKTRIGFGIENLNREHGSYHSQSTI